LLQAAHELAPRIAVAADAIEQGRRLPDDVVDALAAARLFQMLVPASLGGVETDLATFMHVIEIIAAADASTAWCLSQTAGRTLVAAYMERATAKRIFGDPRCVVARGPGAGTVVAVDGGYRLTGAWSFASGCHHATWLEGSGVLVDDEGRPCLRADGKHEERTLLFPAPQAAITDVWDVSGLRGTGSDSFSVKDLFVPSSCAVAWWDGRTERGPLYAFSFNLVFATGFGSVALGVARGALDALIELARTKTPRSGSRVLRESAVLQSEVARAEATLRSARALLQEAIAAAWDAAVSDGEIPLKDRVLLRLAATHAIHAGAEVVDAAYHAAGSTAIFAGNGFERRFRDLHAVTQQIQGSPVHFESVGQFLLGLEPDMSFL
jgi:alkylation response protein AidB-like acyl-CoA dehydrogenase